MWDRLCNNRALVVSYACHNGDVKHLGCIGCASDPALPVHAVCMLVRLSSPQSSTSPASGCPRKPRSSGRSLHVSITVITAACAGSPSPWQQWQHCLSVQHRSSQILLTVGVNAKILHQRRHGVGVRHSHRVDVELAALLAL